MSAAAPLRQAMLLAARSGRLRTFVSGSGLTRGVVGRFIAGEAMDDAVGVADALRGDGLLASLDHLGEEVTDAALAQAGVRAYLDLLDALQAAGLTAAAEVSVKLSALGSRIDAQLGQDGALRIARRAVAAGTTLTLDMEDSSTTEETLRVLQVLRGEQPSTGAVIQAYLRRSEADCARLATPGSRVRLCKGAYAEPPAVAYPSGREVDDSYARCLSVLMSGQGYPMVATHDPKLIRLALDLAGRAWRGPDEFEFQMLYGIRPDEQLRLARLGHRVRVYVPYGKDWYGYLMRRLAERPANLAFFLRSLTGGWRARAGRR